MSFCRVNIIILICLLIVIICSLYIGDRTIPIYFILVTGSVYAILIKPMTYMNLSGEAVAKVMNFYKIPVEDILVISDDLDSTLGRVRLRASGSSGGHNGHKNIALNIGTEEYKRIKIGIDRSKVIPVIDWVLKKLTKEELDVLTPSFEKASDAIYDFINGVDFYKIASKYSC